MAICHRAVVANAANPESQDARLNITCLSGIIRVLMNLSHENGTMHTHIVEIRALNKAIIALDKRGVSRETVKIATSVIFAELCCTKLGQMSGFLPLCMSTFTHLGPKFTPAEKRFDLTVMVRRSSSYPKSMTHSLSLVV